MRDFVITAALLLPQITLSDPVISHPATAGRQTSTTSQTRFQVFRAIEKQYLNEVEPIFRRACYDCHTNLTEYPWYHRVPLAQQWIEHQVHQGQKSITFLQHFPFLGSETTPEEDLVHIGQTIQQQTMPPLGYRVLNKKGKLSAQEVKKIHKWIRKSLEMLQTTPVPTSNHSSYPSDIHYGSVKPKKGGL